MDRILVDSPQPVIDDLSDTLSEHLAAGERVLWLVSGGSNIQVAVEVAKRLQDVQKNNLYVSLVDERYGEVGGSTSNWQQLMEAGFSLDEAHLVPVLDGTSREDAASRFDNWLGDQFGQADYTIGLLGIGADGHTSGIKANSEAVTASGWVTDYTWDDFERITTAFDAIKRLDEVVIYAMGDDKASTLRDLLHHDIPLSTQPAQVLKSVKKSTLYTDYKEDS